MIPVGRERDTMDYRIGSVDEVIATVTALCEGTISLDSSVREVACIRWETGYRVGDTVSRRMKIGVFITVRCVTSLCLIRRWFTQKFR